MFRFMGVIATCLLFALPVSAKDIPVVRIGHVGHDHHLALYMAAHKGKSLSKESGGYWFKELKPAQAYELMKDKTKIAAINLLKVGGGSGMPNAIAQKQIDLGFGGMAPSVLAIDKGAKIKVVAPVNADGDMLMMRPDFPAKNWKEFVSSVKKSKAPVKIGYKAPNSVAYLIFLSTLKSQKIKISDGKGKGVMMVNLMKGSNMLPSLSGGVVDGIVMNQPVVALGVHKKLGKVIVELKDLPPKNKWHNHPCCCLVASDSFSSKHPQLLLALQKVFSASTSSIANNKETFEVAAKWTGKPLAVEKMSLPTNVFVARPNDSWNKGMLQWFAMMKDYKRFRGALKNKSPEEIYEHVADFGNYK